MKKQNTRRTQRSAAKTDRTSVILNLFREAPNNKFSLKHLASASGGASKEGRRETLEILGRLFEEGIVEECAREKYRLTQKHLPHYEGVADMTSSGAVYVRVEGLENDIFVNQRNASNALDGDRVEVAVMHRGRDGKLEGQVTRIVERNRKPYVGVAEVGAHQIFVRADSRRMPMDIYLSKRTCPDIRDGEKVVVRIADWQPGSKSPVGELVERLGMEVPPAFSACPDHLALELDLVAVMLRSGMREEARQFLAERFAWLTAYRMRLLALEDDARFYIGLVDVILAIRAQQTTADAVVA